MRRYHREHLFDIQLQPGLKTDVSLPLGSPQLLYLLHFRYLGILNLRTSL